jgi:hypothetical protein
MGDGFDKMERFMFQIVMISKDVRGMISGSGVSKMADMCTVPIAMPYYKR